MVDPAADDGVHAEGREGRIAVQKHPIESESTKRHLAAVSGKDARSKYGEHHFGLAGSRRARQVDKPEDGHGCQGVCAALQNTTTIPYLPGGRPSGNTSSKGGTSGKHKRASDAAALERN